MNSTIWRDVLEILIRRPSTARYFIRVGLGMFGSGSAVRWVLAIDVPFLEPFSTWTVALQQAAETSLLSYVLLIGGIVLIIIGVTLELRDRRRQLAAEARSLVVGLEVRGLRMASDTPLVDAIPVAFIGLRDPFVIDLRDNVEDGEIADPELAVAELTSVPRDLVRRIQGHGRRHTQVVAGGLAPVPLLFFFGFILDDEHQITLMDWDRHQRDWRSLTSPPMHRALQIDRRYQFVDGKGNATEVALCVSVSYRVDLESVEQLGFPIVHLELPEGDTDQHWSAEDQRHWGQQFLSHLIEFERRGVQQVHLFLACPGSVAIRFGSLYDRRNLPRILIYQYRRAEEGVFPYPWSIKLTPGQSSSAQVHRNFLCGPDKEY